MNFLQSKPGQASTKTAKRLAAKPFNIKIVFHLIVSKANHKMKMATCPRLQKIIGCFALYNYHFDAILHPFVFSTPGHICNDIIE
ncbi:MAG: hypothetical protein ACE5DO_15020 [Desulfobacterales bacterium]